MIRTVILILLTKFTIVCCQPEDRRENVFEEGLVAASDIRHTDNKNMHIAFTLTNILGKTKKIHDNITVEFQMWDKKSKLMVQFEKMVQSLFLHSRGSPIHLIFLTDEESSFVIKNILKNEIGRYLSESIIRVTQVSNSKHILKFPKLKVEFVDISSITSTYKEEISILQKYYGNHAKPGKEPNRKFNFGFKFICEMTQWQWCAGFQLRPQGDDGPVLVPTFKYTLPLFYMLPFYHLVFPEKLKRLLFLDTDLNIQTDLYDVYSHLLKFSETNIMGVALDQTPHYHNIARHFRNRHPDSPVGNVGKYQGYNTGVTLLNLDRMRSSEVYRKYTSVPEMVKLEEKYTIGGTVGDQDWLTLLGWEADSHDLFYILPCEYNRQTDKVYDNDRWREKFPIYHQCDNAAKIIHNNGE